MLDLKQLYDILRYSYTDRDHKPGKSVCIVVVPPTNIGEQFPSDGKNGNDGSPPHVTVGYFGDVDLALESQMAHIAQAVASKAKPFAVGLGPTQMFNNDKQDVLYSSITGKGLPKFRGQLKDAYAMAGMEFDSKHPEYKPHMTIEYIAKGEESKYDDLKPEGQWQAENAWLWGFEQPYLLQFK